MEKIKPDKPSPTFQMMTILRNIDRRIEEWVHHFIDQIDDLNQTGCSINLKMKQTVIGTCDPEVLKKCC